MYAHTKASVRMFLLAFFVKAKNWNQLKSASVGEQLDCGDTHLTDDGPTVKRNKLLLDNNWVSFKPIMLSDKANAIPFMRHP